MSDGEHGFIHSTLLFLKIYTFVSNALRVYFRILAIKYSDCKVWHRFESIKRYTIVIIDSLINLLKI